MLDFKMDNGSRIVFKDDNSVVISDNRIAKQIEKDANNNEINFEISNANQ